MVYKIFLKKAFKNIMAAFSEYNDVMVSHSKLIRLVCNLVLGFQAD